MEKLNPIETKIKEQGDIIRDKTLQALINDLKENILTLEVVEKDGELFEIISELIELTQQKQDIRSALASMPEVVEERTKDVQSRIIELTDEIQKKHPGIVKYIEQRNLQFRDYFASQN